MRLLRARVQGGQLIADAPSGLPEGAVVDVAMVQDVADDEDGAPPDRERLDASIEEAYASYLRGDAVEASIVLDELDRLA